jgi:hypothetical protein
LVQNEIQKKPMAKAAIRCVHASLRTENLTVGSSAERKKRGAQSGQLRGVMEC